MSTNLTVDDSSTDIVYSNNWSAQIPNDPNIASFFESTYHAAQADGATANITFTGSAAYLFGSKGPNHANYSVQYDNSILVNQTASAPQLEFQQPLFSFVFPNTGEHFISISAHFVGDAQWLDLDYVTVYVAQDSNVSSQTGSTINNSGATPTVLPPWISSASTTSPPSTSSSSPVTSSSSTSEALTRTPKTTLILSITFGVVIAVALFIFLALCCLCRQRRKSSEREQDFRYGLRPSAPQDLPPTTAPQMEAHNEIPLGPPYRSLPSQDAVSDRARSPWTTGGSTLLTRSVTPLSTATDARLLNPSTSTNRAIYAPSRLPTLLEKRSTIKAQTVPAPPPTRPKRSPESLLDWLGSGVGWDRSRHNERRDDGNSQKTDFLKV